VLEPDWLSELERLCAAIDHDAVCALATTVERSRS